MHFKVESVSHHCRQGIHHPYMEGLTHKTSTDSTIENGFLVMIFDDHRDKIIKVEAQDIVSELIIKNQGTQMIL